LALIVSACSSSDPLVPDADASPNPSGALDRVAQAKAAASCDELHSEAVAAAKRCDPNAVNQCLVTVRLSLACACYGKVTDRTEASAIADVWTARGCPGNVTFVCPNQCLFSNGTMPCLGDGRGGGVCADYPPD
jgi:hypothetical protein